MRRFFDELIAAIREGQRFALGVVSKVKGSSPQKPGAKALFFEDGRIVGTLGGGCLEAEVRDRARHALVTGVPATFDLLLDHDFGWDDGLICGGKVCGLILPRAAEAAAMWTELASRDRTRSWGVRNDFSIAWVDDSNLDGWLYREMVSPPCALWIAGSGHVAQAVAPLAVHLDFQVTVFDDRPALANYRFFPEATRLRVDDWDLLVNEPLPDGPAFGLVVTRGHNHDALVVRHWTPKPFVFLGMIGSQRKRRIIGARLVEEGLVTQAQWDRVACPVGVDICAVTVPEIAVSVVASLIKERAEKVHGAGVAG
jgi:xanthine dehydrogenase accessory factor